MCFLYGEPKRVSPDLTSLIKKKDMDSALLPPNRTKWGILLGRPLMGTLHRRGCAPRPKDSAQDLLPPGDIVGRVLIAEVIRHDCMVTGRLPSRYGIDVVVRCVKDLTTDDTRWMHELCLFDPDWSDNDFAEAWFGKYGVDWPCVGDGQVHPDLEALSASYDQFGLEWAHDGVERENAFWAWFADAYSTSS